VIKIIIPSNNIKERKYILNIIFNQFFKVPYTTIISQEDINEYQIYMESGKSIIIKDAFFSIYPSDLEYLKTDSIPKRVNYYSHHLFVENNLPILFGVEEIEITKNSITSHIDIFATIFFMLTRWEEYIKNRRDEHNRFPHTASLAYKYNFLNRPIVNEYIEFLWNMFVELDYNGKRKERQFSMLLTHDVDEILRYPNIKKLFTGMVGDIIFRKSLSLPFKTLYDYTLVSMGKRKDPYDSFDEIMDMSDSFEIKSHFFFMSGGTSRYDNRYKITDPLVKKIVDKIKERGHYIGLHPSYNAYNNKEQFKSEKKSLEEINKEPIRCGREHYLRFEVPKTWQIWEDNGFEWCSNLAYAKSAGFRTGCCYPFTPFNILSREQLHLQERPLTMMEVTFIEETKNIKQFNKMVDYYLTTIKRYEGEFVLLWHNASFYEQSIKKYAPSYRRAIKKYKELL
jgi:hypothetical protein